QPCEIQPRSGGHRADRPPGSRRAAARNQTAGNRWFPPTAEISDAHSGKDAPCAKARCSAAHVGGCWFTTTEAALVLSAGGMFGAYQAGAWSVLVDVFQPDLIVGASIGSINGWLIAGGCPPQELIDSWLDMGYASKFRWHLPLR